MQYAKQGARGHPAGAGHDDGRNESTCIPKGTNHRLENPGSVPLDIIEVQSGSYLGEDDIVWFEVVYNRVPQRSYRSHSVVRLSSQTQTIIRDTAREIFGPQATTMVFGSRVDDTARGGDIDLIVQLEQPVQQRERKALQLVARLQMRLGMQPIDVLVVDPQTEILPVHEEAIRTGVRL